MTIWKRAVSVGLSATLLASLLATVVAPAAFAAVTVTAATGGSAISADTTGGTYTALTGPVVAEGAAGDISTGLLTFNAPSGFVFDTGGTNPSFTGGGTGFVMVFVSRTTTSITYQVNAASTAAGTVTFTNWRVRPSAGTPLASGNITFASGGATINGATAGSTNFGTLTEVAGAPSAAGSTLTASPTSLVVGSSSTLTAKVADQFGNGLSGKNVTITQTGGTVFAAPTPASGTTGPGGLVTATVTSSAAGTATYSATDTTDTITLTGTPTVTWTAAPPPPGPVGSGASAVTTSGFGNLARGGTSAAGTFTITEGAVGNFVDGTVTVTPFSSAGVSGTGTTAVWFDPLFQPTATVAAGIGSVSASVSAGGVLTITISGTDATKLDNFTISGLKVKAGATAALGAVQFRYTTTGTNLGLINATASGTLTINTGTGVQSPSYTLAAGSPAFQVTNTTATPPISNATFVGGVTESVALTAASGTNVTANFSTNHPSGTTFSQTVQAQWFPQGATVVDTAALAAVSAPIVLPGVNNQTAGNLTVTLGNAGFIPAAATLTFAITTAGVQFSALPTSVVTSGGAADFAVGTGVLSLDRKSITYTVTTASSTNLQVLTISGIKYDVALSATAGALVNVTLSISGGIAVSGSPAANAQIAQTIIGSGAVPTIIIGNNDQATGLLTIRESAAGTLPDISTSANDKIVVCLTSVGETFNRAPWFVVTAGDLKLNVGGLAATQAKATLGSGNTCAFVQVYTASTVASTIEVRAGVDAANTAPKPSGPNNGATVNVASTATPGPTTVQVSISATGAAGVAQGAPVVVAMRALAGTPIVAAVSQPFVQAGGINQPAGDITITEGSTGNFVPGETITLTLVGQTLSINADTFFANTSGVGMPIVTTNNGTSGLVASLTAMTTSTITVTVNNGAVGALGVITISGIKYNVNVGTANGPVFLMVAKALGGGAAFSSVVSNATIGAPAAVAISADSALGATKVGPFSTTTKVAALGKYVTWRFRGGSALAGKTVQIWVQTKNADGSWGASTKLTARVADGSGNAYFWWKSSAAKWISVRAYYAGDATHSASWSPARQGRWR